MYSVDGRDITAERLEDVCNHLVANIAETISCCVLVLEDSLLTHR